MVYKSSMSLGGGGGDVTLAYLEANYVPYTGAIAEVNIGSNAFRSGGNSYFENITTYGIYSSGDNNLTVDFNHRVAYDAFGVRVYEWGNANTFEASRAFRIAYGSAGGEFNWFYNNEADFNSWAWTSIDVFGQYGGGNVIFNGSPEEGISLGFTGLSGYIGLTVSNSSASLSLNGLAFVYADNGGVSVGTASQSMDLYGNNIINNGYFRHSTNGTALLPVETPEFDTNTGLWFPAADTVAWSTGGVERLRLSSTGVSAPLYNVIGNALGATVSTANTINLINSTAAASGVQQNSPTTIWTGQGWKTTATAASQSVSWAAYTQPVQGSANPTSNWILASSINGAAYSTQVTISSTGQITAGALVSSTTIASTGVMTANRNNIGTTSTDAFVASNTTAALVGVQSQRSPRFRWSGTGWNPTLAASYTTNFIAENIPTPSNPLTSRLAFSHDLNGGGYTEIFSFSNIGALSLSGDVLLGTLGKTLYIKEGTDGMQGQATMTAGVATITINGLTTTDRPHITLTVPAGTLGTSCKAVCTANTLTITSINNAGVTNTLEASTYAYLITRPA